jgi:hypothetical protein
LMAATHLYGTPPQNCACFVFDECYIERSRINVGNKAMHSTVAGHGGAGGSAAEVEEAGVATGMAEVSGWGAASANANTRTTFLYETPPL